MPQSFVSLNYHLIFSTQGREPTLGEGLRPRLFEYVGGIMKSQKASLLAAGGTADHVHWLVSLHQQTSVADALRLVKANSSKWTHEEFPDLQGFGWQAGYGAFSVSVSNLERVETYILGQKDHDRTVTFQEEYLTFLKRHRIVYDERHLWD